MSRYLSNPPILTTNATTVQLDAETSDRIAGDNTLQEEITSIGSSVVNTLNGKKTDVNIVGTGGITISYPDDTTIAIAAPISAIDANGNANKQITLTQGSKTAPALTFAADGAPDTGFYHVADGTFRIVNNATDTLEFTPGGINALVPITGTLHGNADTATLASNATQWSGSNKTISTASPSGGVDGDIWFKRVT
jgi:hypothetical protein